MIITLKNVICSYPTLFTPKAFTAGMDPKYSMTVLLEKDDPQIQSILQVIEAEGERVFQKEWKAVRKELQAQNKFGLQDGAVKATKDGYDGRMFINASNAKAPLVLAQDKSIITRDGVVYGGCIVNVQLDIWVQNNHQYGKRINAMLLAVQFARDGQAFGSVSAADIDAFESIDSSADEYM